MKRSTAMLGCLGAATVISGLFTDAHAGALTRLTAALPEIPDPPQGEAFWVAPSMRMNGLPMTIRGFQSLRRPDEVLAFYESQTYGARTSEHRRSSRGEWLLLSIRSPRHLITVRSRARIGGSEGTITVSARPEG